MNARPLLSLVLIAVLSTVPAPAFAQTLPGRAVRRDLPHTDMIQRAYAAGTRDTTGRPGPSYWQLWMDYTIHASLDPATSIVSGRETAVIHNTSDSPLTSIQLRLDQNIFAANVPKLEAVPEITDGMKVTRLAVNGQDVDLNPPPVRRGRGAPAAEVRLAAYSLGETSARITLSTPIPAHGTGTLDAEWSFRVPAVPAGQRGLRMGQWADCPTPWTRTLRCPWSPRRIGGRGNPHFPGTG